MIGVDPRRTVPARHVDFDVVQSGAGAPGDFHHLTGRFDADVGIALACPGCGRPSYLPLADSASEGPLWTRTPGPLATITLTPSIHHTADLGGCGWHGYLTAGSFAPC